MSNKVLLIAPYFPPRRRVGSIRPFRFVTYLKELGWSPAVICIKEEKRSLTEKEIKVLEGVPLLQVGIPFSKKNDLQKRDSTKKFSLSEFIDNRFPLDTWLPLFIKEKKNILDFSRNFNPDLVWSTSDPWSANYLAAKVSKVLNTPWVADMRDPWTLCNIRYKSRKWPATIVDKKFERKIMQEAGYITFTAKATEKKYTQDYPVIKNKTKTIYNSFDRSFYESDVTSHTLELPKEKLNILFLGKFRELSTATDILRVLETLQENDPEKLKSVYIYSFGDLVGEDLEYVNKLDLEDHFKTISMVPNEKVINLANQFDLLLLSTHPERNDIVPAKLIDYLICKPPVFSLAPNNEVGEIVEKTKIGVHFIGNERNEAADFLAECVSLKQSNKELPYQGISNQVEINNFNAKQTTLQLVDIFKKLIENE